MNQIIAKQARNKKDLVDVFLISLHFAEELATLKSYFAEKLDQQLKQLITEFADITDGGTTRVTTSPGTSRP